MADLQLPYSTPDLPGTGGQLRATAAHFIVEEVPLYAPCGEGQHLYVNLTKEGVTSREMQRRLANLFKVPLGQVGFAGMKDKFARTTQTFSVNVGFVDGEFAAAAVERMQAQLPVTVLWARLHRNKLKLGHLLGNRFQITVVQTPVPGDEAVRRAEAVAERLRAQGLPNYFGPQRFGADGDNIDRGLELLQGKAEIRDRWLRQLLISAYQSHLCNQYLAARVESGAFQRLLQGDIAKKYATGGMFEVEDAQTEQARYLGQEISFTAPIYGSKMWQATAEAGALEQEVLAASALTMAELERARAGGTRRMGRLLVEELTVEPVSDGIAVRFFLRKGAYATTVLREMMKVDLAGAPDVADDETADE